MLSEKASFYYQGKQGPPKTLVIWPSKALGEFLGWSARANLKGLLSSNLKANENTASKTWSTSSLNCRARAGNGGSAEVSITLIHAV